MLSYLPRNNYVLTSLDNYLNADINFVIEYHDKDGSIQQVRTHSPLTVLTSIPRIDGFTAEQVCMNALRRWNTQSFGWSQP
ncbi:MAG: hypothetical protein SOW45_08655 [Prevotella sp.]|nr:hypothetical protein [Prevotella sp.]